MPYPSERASPSLVKSCSVSPLFLPIPEQQEEFLLFCLTALGFRSFLFCLAWLHTLRAASGHSTVWLGFPLGSAWRGASYLLVLHHCVPFQGWHFPMACVLQCLSCSFKMKCTFERTEGLLEATFGHVFRENTVAFALAVNSPLAQNG